MSQGDRRIMSRSNIATVGALALIFSVAVGTGCEKPLIGPAPRLEANPAEITFSSVGESGGETVLFLKNAGSADLVITGLSWAGTAGVEATWVGRAAPSAEAPLVLAPGIPFNLPISYRVVAEQDPTGTFTVYSNDPGPLRAEDLHRRIGELDIPALSLPNNPAVQIFTAERNGENIGDARLVAGDRIDFGEVPANQTRYARVTIKNDGHRPLVIQSVSVIASEPATAFSLSGAAPAANSRVVPARTTTAGDAVNELTFDVKYLSPSTARATGKLVIVSNDPVRPTHTIILVGGAITCNLVATPNPLDFGAVVRGQNAERTVTLENQGAANCSIDSIAMQPGQSADLTIVPNSVFISGAAQPAAFNLAPNGRATFKVRYDSRDDNADVGHVIVRHREPQRDLDIRVVGTPINNAPPVCVCPASPIDTAPLQTIQLDGSRSNDPEGRTPLTCQWTALSRPNGSTEPIGNASTARASFFVDLAGDYKFQLLCKDNYNAECAPCTVDVRAVPTDDLHIQLVWDTPTVDVDLHLLRAGATTTWFGADDCYFGNRTPQWFTPSSADNPRLDIDDTDGYGPENINVQRPAASPVNQPYKIGIHYYSDDGIGATRATVRVYCFGTLAAEKGPVFLQKTNKWWDVGTIAWPGCQLTVNDPPPITDRAPSSPLFP